jgi:non-ribosomal peptide synthetase component F
MPLEKLLLVPCLGNNLEKFFSPAMLLFLFISMQVMFNFTDDPELILDLSDSLEVTRLPLPDLGTSQFELTMLFIAGDGIGSIQVEYSTSIFNASTVSGIVDNYIELLSSVVASPEAPLCQLEMISESQRAELAAFSTGPDRKDFIYGPLVHEQFATRAAAAPEAPCLLFKSEARTYGDVIAAVDQLAARLIKSGVVPSSVVGVMMPRSPALVIAMMATMKVGGVYMPLDTNLIPGRLAVYIKEAAPAVLLVAETTNVEAVMAALPPQLQKPSVMHVEEYDDTTMTALSTDQVQLNGADVAALVFAAGPAGRPYGVEITHAGLRDLVGWTYNESIGTSREDVYALTISVSSSTNMATVLAALAAGAAVAILPPGDETNADAVASFCVSTKVTILEQSPMALEIYVPRLKAVSSELDIRVVIIRGELPKPTLIAGLKDALPFAKESILSMYGMNEFSISAITSHYGYMPNKITLGLPDPNVQVYVVHPDDVSRLQPVGMRGELLLTGVRLARGYWKNSQMTSERFLPNPFLKQDASKAEVELLGRVYRTGDLVSWDREGQLCYHGLVNPDANKIGVRLGEGQDGKNLSAEDRAQVAIFAVGEKRENFFTHPLVHEAFEAIATSSPNQKCLFYEGRWLTYGDVALRSAALALKLHALGVGPGVPVGIMLERSFDLMISILAAFRAGGCYVPCDPSFPDGRLRNYLEDSKATVVLTHTKDTERARGIVKSETVQVIDLADYDLEKTKTKSLATVNGLNRAGPEDPAYIIFTSGSTGHPKGVVIPHRSLRDHALGLVDYYSITANDTCLLSSVINFDAHIMQSVPPLVIGAGLVIVRPNGHIDPEYMSNLIASGKVTHALTTPSLALVQFRGHEVATCTSLRCMLIGGEAMQREVINLFAAKVIQKPEVLLLKEKQHFICFLPFK